MYAWARFHFFSSAMSICMHLNRAPWRMCSGQLPSERHGALMNRLILTLGSWLDVLLVASAKTDGSGDGREPGSEGGEQGRAHRN